MIAGQVPEYTRKNRGSNKFGIAVITRFMVIVILTLCTHNVLADDETLKTGEWEGTFLTHEGELWKIKFIVSRDKESVKQPIKIKMINLEFEPICEFSYQLTDIKIGKETIEFKIPKKHETKVCTLKKKEDNSYTGTCQSTAGSADEKSEITMIPVEKTSSQSGPPKSDTTKSESSESDTP